MELLPKKANKQTTELKATKESLFRPLHTNAKKQIYIETWIKVVYRLDVSIKFYFISSFQCRYHRT